jgi:hypothetical protein
LDKFSKPIKMGSVFETNNGGEQSKIQAKKIFHAVVAGESRIPADAGAITLVEVLKVKLVPFDPNKFVEFLYIVSNVC